MKPSERRKLLRQGHEERVKEETARKDDKGRFGSIFIKDKMTDVKKYNPATDAEHLLDIIPYIAGKNHPQVLPGKMAYVVEVYIHRGIGINEDSVICRNMTFKDVKHFKTDTRCPICEYRARLMKEKNYDEKLAKKLMWTRRAIYNVWVHSNSKEEEKGIQIYDVSHYLFTREVVERAQKMGKITSYADPDIGKSVFFKKKGKNETTELIGFSFEDRAEPIPDEILDKAHVIEELINFQSFEDINKILWTGMKEPEKATDEESAGDEETTTEEETTTTEGDGVPEFVCPEADGIFGESFSTMRACKKCELRNDCEAESDRLEAEKEGQETSTEETNQEEEARIAAEAEEERKTKEALAKKAAEAEAKKKADSDAPAAPKGRQPIKRTRVGR
jgi:hypothetical protein